jgi:hypothetical protein
MIEWFLSLLGIRRWHNPYAVKSVFRNHQWQRFHEEHNR